MSNEFRGTGNIGQAPVLRTVKVNGENRSVTDLRIFFDRSIPLDDGTYEDGGGFWLTVSTWGHRADSAVKLMVKGMRVHVKGSLRQDSWKDDAGEEKSELRLTADHISIDPVCLDSVVLRKRNGQGDGLNLPQSGEGLPLTDSNQSILVSSGEESQY
ncbi:MAG: single-stranded DNA-binding protein [Methyloglobulus sp.]|nr:single-stranded DNA-binding protein [Methyloglobulus sp.]